MQVVNADAMVVKLNSGEYKTIHLSSIRPPRIEGEVKQECVCQCACGAIMHNEPIVALRHNRLASLPAYC